MKFDINEMEREHPEAYHFFIEAFANLDEGNPELSKKIVDAIKKGRLDIKLIVEDVELNFPTTMEKIYSMMEKDLADRAARMAINPQNEREDLIAEAIAEYREEAEALSENLLRKVQKIAEGNDGR